MGPDRFALRRLPIRRVMYEQHWAALTDRVNPFEIASGVKPAGWRGSIGIMMGAFAIDVADEQRAAWRALTRARRGAGFDAARLAEMERLFYGFPEHRMPDGGVLAFSPENFKAISDSWKDRAFRTRCEIAYAAFFRESYARVVELGAGRPLAPPEARYGEPHAPVGR